MATTTYGPGDIKQEQVVNTIQVNDTWGDGESGQYDFDATGAPAVNGNNLTYGQEILNRNKL